MTDNNLDALIEKSASTDVQVLLNAKEQAKRQSLDAPSATNLAAFDRASKMLENAVNAKKDFKNWREVLDYLKEDCGRKVGQTKLFDDISKARLRKQTDGTFKQRDVDRYAASLKLAGTSDAVAEKAADRQRRKEEADIRKAEAAAEREEFDLAVKKGKFVPRDQVHLDLAARAVTLSSGLKTVFEAQTLELVSLVNGNPRKVAALVERLEALLDDALSEYSREMAFEVTFVEDNEQVKIKTTS